MTADNALAATAVECRVRGLCCSEGEAAAKKVRDELADSAPIQDKGSWARSEGEAQRRANAEARDAVVVVTDKCMVEACRMCAPCSRMEDVGLTEDLLRT